MSKKTKSTKINKEKSDTIDIWVCTNDKSKVRRFYPNEEEAEKYAETINDDIFSPASINLNLLRIKKDNIKTNLIGFLNNHAYIATT